MADPKSPPWEGGGPSAARRGGCNAEPPRLLAEAHPSFPRRGFWITRTIAVLILGVPFAFSLQQGFPQFVDVAAKVGIKLMNICGGASKDYIVEANGNGAAFFDYDNDGNMDVLIVNGSTLDNYKKGGDQMVALYKNNNGTFVDVTERNRRDGPKSGGICYHALERGARGTG